MECRNHKNQHGVNTCGYCGDWLCEGCSVEVNGRVLCKECISSFVPSKPGRGARKTEYEDRRYVSKMWLFIFSWIPGANHMYMGLMKRGLLTMGLFFGSIMIVDSVFRNGAMAFLPAMGFIWSFFDGFNIRRRINNGEKVEDNLDEATDFVMNHKVAILAGSVILSILSNPFNSYNSVDRLLFRCDPSVLLMVLLIVGIFMSRKRGKKEVIHSKYTHDETVDHNNINN